MTSIHVVLDPTFRGSILEYASLGAHVWLVESEENRKLAEAYWDGTGGSQQVSTFTALHNDGLSDALELLEDHYGEFTDFEPVDQITVHGGGDVQDVAKVMREWGFLLAGADGECLLFSLADDPR